MTTRRLPPLHAIRAFEAAARHRSVTRAASELNVTPGAVSRHLRGLEAELQTVLFQRTSQGLVLTPTGETLAAVAREALDGLANAVSGLRLRRFRRLTIGAYGFFVSRALLPRWKRLATTHPELSIDLHTSSNALDLTPSRYDAVIAVSDGAPRPGTIIRRLMPISTVPVCSPLLLVGTGVDFATVPLLHARPRPDDWPRWLHHAGYRTAHAGAGSSFESLGLALDAAAAGLGMAMAIDGLVAEDFASGRLMRAHATTRPTRRHFVLQYEQRRADDPALLLFQGWLMREFGAPASDGT